MKKFNIKVDGVMHEVEVEELGGSFTQNAASLTQSVAPTSVAAQAPKSSVSASKGSILAPLQGTVQTIKVNVGDKVNAGDVVAIIEAMKMENEIPSNISGTVKAIHVTKGAKVSANDVLLDIE